MMVVCAVVLWCVVAAQSRVLALSLRSPGWDTRRANHLNNAPAFATATQCLLSMWFGHNRQTGDGWPFSGT